MTKVFIPDKDSDKIPILPTICYCSLSFLDLFCLNLVLPNIPFMCSHFFPDISATEIGFYSGYLTACYPLGGIFGNLLFGYIADRFGRKPCFLISSFGTFLCMNVFGLSANYPMALITRFLWGLCNGAVGVVKTYVSEVSSRKTQSLGFSLLSVSSGLSRVIGPLMGGLLVNPQINYPEFTNMFPLFKTYPFYLPCFIAGIICLIVFLFTLVFLPETLSKEEIHKRQEMKAHYANQCRLIKEKKVKNPHYVYTEKEEILVQLSQDSYIELLKNKYVVITAVLYGMTGFVQGVHDAILPLWLLNPVGKGGFEWDQTNMGYLYAGVGPIQIVFTHILYIELYICVNIKGIIFALFSYKSIYFGSGLLYGLELILYPLVSYSNQTNESIQWFFILISFAFSLCTRLCNFTYPYKNIYNIY
ncbi:hypothetical protein WA158_001038 [Blastocystis sp. Blastoise]